MNPNYNNPDRFGYYTVGSYKTYSKLDAIREQQTTGIFPQWHFNEEAFDSVDWTQEPTMSLTALYKKRAEQLREKYDYLVLFYSGGADSTTVLDTFVNNNIHLDEICTWTYYKGNGHKYAGTDAEVTKVAHPYAKEIVKNNPHIKYRFFDMSDMIYALSYETNTLESFLFRQSSIFMPKVSAWHEIYNQVSDYKQAIDRGDKIGFIWASDKPRLIHENNRYAVRFLDIIDNVAKPGNTDPIELFYWSPDCPEIIIKQGHIVKNYLEHSNESSYHIVRNSTGLAYKQTPTGKLWLTTHGLHSLIYPTWNNDTFTAGKTPSPIIDTNTSSWFFNMTTDRANQQWNGIMSSVWQQFPSAWRNDPNDLSKGIKGMVSKNYYLN